MRVPMSTVSAEYTGFIVAFIANTSLIFLILTQTKQNFGSYKYLMLWFAFFSLWYSIIDIVTQPSMHSYKNAFVVICASWFKYNQQVGPIIIATYCTSFGLTVVLLAIHFIYRYIAISRPDNLRYFQWPICFIWPVLFFGVAVFWFCDVYFLMFCNDAYMNDYLRETILVHYKDDIEKLSYIGPLYYVFDPNGNIIINWLSFIAIFSIYIISITTLTTILTLGYRIYQKMKNVRVLIAPKTRELQRQLFHALMVQTIVPIIFMYIPVSFLFLTPVFGIEVGSMANMTSVSLALYPALDPMVAMLFIADYRRFILPIFSTSFGLTVVLLAIHFVYRYIVISRQGYLRYFQWPTCFIWPVLFFGVAIFWWCDVYFLLHSNEEVMNSYMRETVATIYQDEIENLSYIGPIYYIIEPNGSYIIDWLSCIAILNIYVIAIATLFTIVTLGFRIHRKMQSVKNMLARKTRELQRQLFYALMVQTIVPIIFMYTPATVLFLSPLFGIELGNKVHMTSIFLALYPALDPMVVMLIITDYRRYILRKVFGYIETSPITTRVSTTTTKNNSLI